MFDSVHSPYLHDFDTMSYLHTGLFLSHLPQISLSLSFKVWECGLLPRSIYFAIAVTSLIP